MWLDASAPCCASKAQSTAAGHRTGTLLARIGIDLGGTKCLGVVINEQGNQLAEHRVPTPRGEGPVLDAIVEVATQLEAAGNPEGSHTVGVGYPGLIDAGGAVHFAPHLAGIEYLDLRTKLQERLGDATHVMVDNDANCAAWGERRFGAGEGAREVLLVTLGTGVGGGIVANGALVRGQHGFAAEVGHMVVDHSGPPCPCGKNGCWERYASGSGLGWLARQAAYADVRSRTVELAGGDPEAVKGEHVAQAAAEGDAHALAVMHRFAWWLALGLTNLTALLDPERIIIGGGLVESAGVWLDSAQASFDELLYAKKFRPPVKLVAANLGEYAGAIGAADLGARPEI